jgi:hypothetical protein
MGYHDGYVRPNAAGNGVTNSIREQQTRLTQFESFLKEIADEVKNKELKAKIEKFLND